MTTLLSASLTMAAPLAFVSVDTMLVVAAGLAGGGALLAGLLAFRAGRRRPSAEDGVVRRAPSPASLGLADDPIVAALGLGDEDARRPRGVRRADQIEP